MTDTAARRYFGRCPVCNARYVVEALGVKPPSGGRRKERLILADESKRCCKPCGDWPIVWTGLKSTTNTTKCSAKCSDSASPICKCSCGGENHGSTHV